MWEMCNLQASVLYSVYAATLSQRLKADLPDRRGVLPTGSLGSCSADHPPHKSKEAWDAVCLGSSLRGRFKTR